MKKSLIILSLLAFIFAISCKKDKTTPQPKVKTKTEGGITQTYTYDAQGRQLQIFYNTLSLHDTVIYRTDSILFLSVSSTGVLTQSFAMPVNSLGLVTGYASSLFSSESYAYNSDKYRILTNTNSLFSSTKDTAYISNGNVIRNISTTNSSFTTTQEVHDYTFSDKSNSISNEAFGLQYKGKSNQQLINTEIATSTTISCPAPSCGSPTTRTYNYTYEFDSNGWVTKRTITDVGASTSTVTSYTYY